MFTYNQSIDYPNNEPLIVSIYNYPMYDINISHCIPFTSIDTCPFFQDEEARFSAVRMAPKTPPAFRSYPSEARRRYGKARSWRGVRQ